MKELEWLIKKYNDRKTAINSVYRDAVDSDNKKLIHLCSADILALNEFIADLERVYKIFTRDA